MAHTETETTVHEHAERKSVGENYFVGVILLLAAIAFYAFFAIPEFQGIMHDIGLM
ncbi:MAG: hypothetical protein ACM3W4_06820 [Ignavibacteriales bacterium]